MTRPTRHLLIVCFDARTSLMQLHCHLFCFGLGLVPDQLGILFWLFITSLFSVDMSTQCS